MQSQEFPETESGSQARTGRSTYRCPGTHLRWDRIKFSAVPQHEPQMRQKLEFSVNA